MECVVLRQTEEIMMHEKDKGTILLLAQSAFSWLKQRRAEVELQCRPEDRDVLVAQWMRGLIPEREARQYLAYLEEDEANEPKRKEGALYG
jgi:hypothetical protein